MHGTRAEQEAFGNRLIDYAKKNGLYREPAAWGSFGERKRKPSGECVVYIDEANERVIKVKDPYAKAPMKGHAASDAIFEHVVHNILFPNTKYRLVGISNSPIGDVRFMLEQHYMKDGFEPATQKDIDKYLSDTLSLNKEGKYWYGNDYYAITDVDAASDNVLADDNGNLFFIDPIIKFKKPATEVIDNLLQSMSSTERTNFMETYSLEQTLWEDFIRNAQ
ncbi:MAG: hypothetical protein IJ634_08365 [Bacteroidales bacterium]|nr:hypothetical protein [Bacteroidales bacterium]